MHYFAIFYLIMCCSFATVRLEFFAQSLGEAGAATSWSTVPTSNSSSNRNSVVSFDNSAVFSVNAAVSSGNSALSSGNSAVPFGNTAIYSGNLEISSRNSATPSTSNSKVFTSRTASEEAALTSGHQVRRSIPGDVPPSLPDQYIPSPVDQLARSISDGLINSPVFGSYTHFELYQPHDIFFRVGTKLLAAAGFYNPDVVEIVAQAVVDIGWVTSQVYFDATGYLLANVVKEKGILTDYNLDYLSLRFVAANDLVGCINGVYDIESMIYANVIGFFSVLDTYGYTTYEDMTGLFYAFSKLLREFSNN